MKERANCDPAPPPWPHVEQPENDLMPLPGRGMFGCVNARLARAPNPKARGPGSKQLPLTSSKGEDDDARSIGGPVLL